MKHERVWVTLFTKAGASNPQVKRNREDSEHLWPLYLLGETIPVWS